ncbi:MAG: tRNA adenosine(34) deaminase TadA [Desulfitobacteriaceae bacterium]|nr:tRNA adenosine(34) deaminase TadA [Desulfitobacteriaceae bacterium]MDD4751865.1 tRNA adenosine(34) deaminase TadA [Desulfitobacteriaceae bacterium]
MKEALIEAETALSKGEVPIGAVIVFNGEIIARAHNLKEERKDPTAHAEILAIQQATAKLNNWRLNGSTIYVTIEPCPMCAGALVQARVDRLVLGAWDAKAGAAGSLVNLVQFSQFNHRMEVIGGVMEEECRRMMQRFFEKLR